MNQLWQFWQGHLHNDIIDGIVDSGKRYPIANAGLGFDGSTSNDQYRSSEIRWIPQMDTPFLKDLLWYYAQEANKNAFGFDINYIADIQYTTYRAEDNGKYDWHCDTFWANPTTYDRKISIVIQLSDPSEYDGGDFMIDQQYEQLPAEAIRAKGTVIVFPSFINHCVTPVTRGTRRSLVSWIQGPKFR